MAVLFVFPLLAIIVSQAAGVFFIHVGWLLIVAALLAAGDVLVYLLVVAQLDRERILTSL